MTELNCTAYGVLAGGNVVANSGTTTITGSLASFNSITGSGSYTVTNKTVIGAAMNTLLTNTLNDYNTFINLPPTNVSSSTEIGGTTYVPGVYSFTSVNTTFGVGSGNNTITLNGAGTYVFQFPNGNFSTDSTLANISIIQSNNATTSELFWVVNGNVNLQSIGSNTTSFAGLVICSGNITIGTSSASNGSLVAPFNTGVVTINNNNITATQPDYNELIPYITNGVLGATIDGNEYLYFGDKRYEIIISTNTQSHYNSLAAAILANNIPNQVFVIYPGTYIEPNPITLPAGCTIYSVGSFITTFIVAQNPAADLFVLGKQATITGLTLSGASTFGSRGIYFDATQSGVVGKVCQITNCQITDCSFGIECDGKNSVGPIDTLILNEVFVNASAFNLSYGIYCHSSGQVVGNICTVRGSLAKTITYGLYATDPATALTMISSSAFFCQNGVYVVNSATIQLSTMNCPRNSTAVTIGSGGISTLIVSTLVCTSSTIYDINIQATNANVQIYSSFIDDTKFNNPNNVNVAIKYNSIKFGNYYQTQLGDSQIGSTVQPSRLAIGEGLYVDSNIVVFSNTNGTIGTWADNTTAALTLNGPPFNIVPSTSTNACMYLGGPTPTFGVSILIAAATTSTTLMTDVVWEYWNSSSWVSFNTMQILFNTRTIYMNSFVTLASQFDIRFGVNSVTPFALLTLNGVSRYWVRWRVVNTLSSIPTGNNVHIRTNTSIINRDGFHEDHGSSRVFKSKAIQWYPANCSPSSNELFFASNLSVAKINNVFSSGSYIRVGFSIKVPSHIDVSFPMKLNISFIGDNSAAGNVSFLFEYVVSNTGNNIYLNVTDAINNPNPNIISTSVIVSVGSNQNNTNLTAIIPLNVSTFPPNLTTSNNYYIYGALGRNSGVDVNDTYSGNVILANLDMTYVLWSKGAHLMNF